MFVTTKNERVSTSVLFAWVTETFRRAAKVVQNTWNVKTAKPPNTAVLTNRTGGSTMTPTNVSLSRRTATRVKVTSTSTYVHFFP